MGISFCKVEPNSVCSVAVAQIFQIDVTGMFFLVLLVEI